jgi:hypothetical protein
METILEILRSIIIYQATPVTAASNNDEKCVLPDESQPGQGRH